MADKGGRGSGMKEEEEAEEERLSIPSIPGLVPFARFAVYTGRKGESVHVDRRRAAVKIRKD